MILYLIHWMIIDNEEHILFYLIIMCLFKVKKIINLQIRLSNLRLISYIILVYKFMVNLAYIYYFLKRLQLLFHILFHHL